MSVFSFLNQTTKHSRSQVTEEYLKIINPGSNAQLMSNSNLEKQLQNYIIPSFYIKKNCSNNIIMDVLNLKKKQQYLKKIVTDEDIQLIQDKLCNCQNCKLSQIDTSSICNQIGEEKSMIFQNSIMKRFETRTGDFDLRNYIKFLKYFSKTQYSLLYLLQIDDTFNNIISKKQLKDFVKLCSSRINSLKDLHEDFFENYTIIITEYLIFDIFPVFINWFQIKDLLCSVSFRRFIQMDDFDLSTNPFSIDNTHNLYDLYQLLVSKTNNNSTNNRQPKPNLINMESLTYLDSYHFTHAFLYRLFEVMPLIEGEYFDLSLFLSFYIPLLNMNTNGGTHFFFKLIDIDEDEVITISDILYFYKANVKESGLDAQTIEFGSFLSELFDLIGCKTKSVNEELLNRSQNQSVFFNLLIDLNTFSDWGNNLDDDDDDFDFDFNFNLD